MRVVSWVTYRRANVAVDLQHALFRITLAGKLYLAPIGPNPHHVLDIGTGETQYHKSLLSQS